MSIWPVRQADLEDWPAIQAFFKTLDKESRYLYFGGHVSDEVIDQVWSKFESAEHRFFVVEVACGIIGVCQIAHQQTQAELSVAVATRYRSQGIAHALVERAVTWCKTHAIKDLRMYCLPDNDVIPKILKRHNLLPLMLAKPAEARFAVPDPTVIDLQKEFGMCVANWWINRWRQWRQSLVVNPS